jgi:hypothetical protein
MQILRQVFRKLVVALFAGVLLFEEWGWEPLAAVFGRLARLPLWGWLERKITQLAPMPALLVIAVPMLTLLPVKLLALFLFGKGQTALGLFLLLGAKLVGTALMARLFQLTQPALMQLGWFARWYPRWKNWKDGVLAEIRLSAPWRAGQRAKRVARAWWKRASR